MEEFGITSRRGTEGLHAKFIYSVDREEEKTEKKQSKVLNLNTEFTN